MNNTESDSKALESDKEDNNAHWKYNMNVIAAFFNNKQEKQTNNSIHEEDKNTEVHFTVSITLRESLNVFVL